MTLNCSDFVFLSLLSRILPANTSHPRSTHYYSKRCSLIPKIHVACLHYTNTSSRARADLSTTTVFVISLAHRQPSKLNSRMPSAPQLFIKVWHAIGQRTICQPSRRGDHVCAIHRLAICMAPKLFLFLTTSQSTYAMIVQRKSICIYILQS